MKGLYVHIPFCRAICTYCDFIKEVAKPEKQTRYINALIAEVTMAASRLSGVTTLYVGGGTPSLLKEGDLHALFQAIYAIVPRTQLHEVTIEANPEDITASKAKLFKSLGINRVSLGVQTFNDALLGFLRRTHKRDDVKHAVNHLKTHGIDNLNIDMIFAIPAQDEAILNDDLKTLIELNPDHISAYSLIVEEGTRLKTLIDKGEVTPTDEDTEAKMFETVMDTLTNAGYTHYEVSNFARPNRQSIHNRIYWENGEYIGLGVAAHGHEKGRRIANTARVKDYIERLECGRSPIVFDEPDEGLKDSLLMGLRLREGVSLATLKARHGTDVFTQYPELKTAQDNGLVEVVEGNLRLTRRGVLLGNEVFMIF